MDGDVDFESGVVTNGTEFGAVDNPATGGSGDPGTTGNWYTGAWGDNIASTEDHGVSLPASTLAKFGYKGPKDTGFRDRFSQNYQVDLLDPKTGDPVLPDAPLKDIGPGEHQRAGIDLMYATARALGRSPNSSGPVAFRIVPRAQPTEQQSTQSQEDTTAPRAEAVPPPAPSWSDIQNSESFQNLQPEQQQQVLTKWKDDTYKHADAIGGFSPDARGALWDFYHQQQQALTPKPQGPVEYAKQVAGAANVSATEADVGAAAANIAPPKNLPKPIDTSLVTDPAQKAEIDRLNQVVQQQDQERYQKQLQQGLLQVQQQRKDLQAQGKPMPAAYEIGGAIPNIAAGTIGAAAGGPAGIAAVSGQQMGGQVAGEAFQEARKQIAERSPYLTPEHVDMIASHIANEASKMATVGGMMLGASGIKWPIQGLVRRILANVGFGAVTQGAVGGAVQAGENAAMQHIQPERKLEQGVPQAVAQGAVLGGVMGGINAIGAPVKRGDVAAIEPAPGEWIHHEEPQSPAQAGYTPQPGDKPAVLVDGQVHADISHTRAWEKAGEPEKFGYGWLDSQGKYHEDTDSAAVTAAREKEQVPPAEGTTEFHAGLGGLGKFLPKMDVARAILPNIERLKSVPGGDTLVKATQEWRNSSDRDIGIQSSLDKALKKDKPLQAEVEQLLKNNVGANQATAGTQAGMTRQQFYAQPMSDKARSWLMGWEQAYRSYGERMRQGGFLVRNPDGSTRNFIGVPQNIFPDTRVMRPDVAAVLRDGIYESPEKLTPKAQKIFDEGRQYMVIDNNGNQRPLWQNPKDMEAIMKQVSLDPQQDPSLTSLERARTMQLPQQFYTYHPASLMQQLKQQAMAVARLENFGQTIGGGKDLFGKAEDIVNSQIATLGQKKAGDAIAAINDLKRNVYGLNRSGPVQQGFQLAASAGFAGNPHTGGNIGIGGIMQNVAYQGLGRTLRSIPWKGFDETYRMGMGSKTFTTLLDDPMYPQEQGRLKGIGQWLLRVPGMHGTWQDLTRSITINSANRWLDEVALPQLQKDPQMRESSTRQIAEDIQRRGLDPTAFSQGNISQELRDRYVREYTHAIQTTYRPEEFPGWTSSPVGRVMFQFGHWSYSYAKALYKEVVGPMFDAIGKKTNDKWTPDGALAARYFGRLGGIALAAAPVAAEVRRKWDELFGRPSNVATIGEILQAQHSGDNGAALSMLSKRLGQDIIGSSVLGMFGDIANVTKAGFQGKLDTAHVFNPLAPAGIGYLQQFAKVAETAIQQGGQLSNRQKANLAYNAFSGLHETQNLMDTAGVPTAGHEAAIGYREKQFARSRFQMFLDSNPGIEKRMSTFVGDPRTPERQNLEDAIYGNDIEGGRKIVNQIAQQGGKHALVGLRTSMASRAPAPSGTAGAEFYRWFSKNGTPEEMQRISQAQEKFISNAIRMGALKSSDIVKQEFGAPHKGGLPMINMNP